VMADATIRPRHDAPPAADAPPPKAQRRQLNCLGKTLVAFVDGGSFGAAIGAIIASAQSVSSLASGTESIFGAIRGVATAGWRSGVSLGFALAGYSGGICYMERVRGTKDVVNPFFIGGMMGAVGSVQRVDYHDGQTKRRVLHMNPRVMLGSATSSALLCSVFWYMQQPSRAKREAQEQQQLQQQQQPAAASIAPPSAGIARPLPLPSELLTDGAVAEVETSPFPTTGFAQGLLPDGLLSGDSPESHPPPPLQELNLQPLPEPANESALAATTTTPAAGGGAEKVMSDGQLQDPWAK